MRCGYCLRVHEPDRCAAFVTFLRAHDPRLREQRKRAGSRWAGVRAALGQDGHTDAHDPRTTAD